MFLFLFLSSRSMMKFCVLGGSSIRLGIVLLSPHSQAPGPGHAAAMRHFGGLPLLPSFLYQGFLLLWTGAAGIHQQLSPDWRGSTPSSSFSCSSSPPTSLLKTTHTHTVLQARLSSLHAYPWYLLVCLFVCLVGFFFRWRIVAPSHPSPWISGHSRSNFHLLPDANVNVAGKLRPSSLETVRVIVLSVRQTSHFFALPWKCKNVG